MLSDTPEAPVRHLPDERWEHYEIYSHVREAIISLPFFFKTETVISGVIATDIFTLNATLGATIEEQVVATLNAMRPIWDPGDKYKLYGFVRQSQTFPDVLLRQLSQSTPGEGIILGLELKGWYLLAVPRLVKKAEEREGIGYDDGETVDGHRGQGVSKGAVNGLV